MMPETKAQHCQITQKNQPILSGQLGPGLGKVSHGFAERLPGTHKNKSN